MTLETDVSARGTLPHGSDVQINRLAMAAAANVRYLRHNAAHHWRRSASRLIGAAVRVKVEVAQRFRYSVTYSTFSLQLLLTFFEIYVYHRHPCGLYQRISHQTDRAARKKAFRGRKVRPDPNL